MPILPVYAVRTSRVPPERSTRSDVRTGEDGVTLVEIMVALRFCS